jgi:CRP/FNR family transcriptional regulator, cyclic AMP receptor protein
MAIKKSTPVNWETLLAGIAREKTVVAYSAGCRIFDQGQPADSIFYLRQGKVKLSVISQHDKEAIVATLRAGEFLGEGCLAGQPLRMATATTVTET